MYIYNIYIIYYILYICALGYQPTLKNTSPLFFAKPVINQKVFVYELLSFKHLRFKLIFYVKTATPLKRSTVTRPLKTEILSSPPS